MLREREAASLVSPGGGDVVALSRAVPWYRWDPELLCHAKVVVKEREEAWGDRMIKAQGETTLGAAWCFQDVGAAEPRGGREGAGPGTGTDTDHGERSPQRLDDKDGVLVRVRPRVSVFPSLILKHQEERFIPEQ